jgi:hypothetical protein
MKSVFFLLFLLSIVAGLSASDRDDAKLLEQMYKDIISTIPQSQRQFIDSAYKQYPDHASAPVSNDSIPSQQDQQHNIQNKLQEKIYQQIDESREKRIIHFMSTDPQTEMK